MMILGRGYPFDQGSICDIDLTSPMEYLVFHGRTSLHCTTTWFCLFRFYGYYCPKILKKDKVSPHIESEGGGH
jgi:FHS family L-fucose permease-like MFS transporter